MATWHVEVTLSCLPRQLYPFNFYFIFSSFFYFSFLPLHLSLSHYFESLKDPPRNPKINTETAALCPTIEPSNPDPQPRPPTPTLRFQNTIATCNFVHYSVTLTQFLIPMFTLDTPFPSHELSSMKMKRVLKP